MSCWMNRSNLEWWWCGYGGSRKRFMMCWLRRTKLLLLLWWIECCYGLMTYAYNLWCLKETSIGIVVSDLDLWRYWKGNQRKNGEGYCCLCEVFMVSTLLEFFGAMCSWENYLREWGFDLFPWGCNFWFVFLSNFVQVI